MFQLDTGLNSRVYSTLVHFFPYAPEKEVSFTAVSCRLYRTIRLMLLLSEEDSLM